MRSSLSLSIMPLFLPSACTGVCVLSLFSPVWLFETLWTARVLCPWDSPGKNTGVGCRALLQGIFGGDLPHPGIEPTLSYASCISRQVLLPPEPPGKPLPSPKCRAYFHTSSRLAGWSQKLRFGVLFLFFSFSHKKLGSSWGVQKVLGRGIEGKKNLELEEWKMASN